jgi:hypothetical protein
MKMGEVDGKKIGCTVSLLVSNLFSFFSFILTFVFHRDTVVVCF